METYSTPHEVTLDDHHHEGAGGNTGKTVSSVDKTAAQEEGTPPTRCPRPLIVILTLLFIAVSVPCLFVFGILSNEDLEGVPLLGDVDFDTFFDTDPFGGEVSPANPEDAYHWANRGVGLELYVLNALDDTWQNEFDTSLREWDNGSPDTLTLTTRRVDYEFECQAETGIMKVCNGDYGATEWRGLNVVLLNFQNRNIYASEAKLNEYYLKEASAAQRQYTMCHELGHGFGLPHWDENFDNRNMGNCMDYTSKPRTNKQPDSSNFEFLKALYGEVGSTLPPSSTSSVADSNSPGYVGWGGGRRGNLRHMSTTEELPYEEVLPEGEVLRSFKNALAELEVGSDQSNWQLLSSDDSGEAYEINLGGSFVARAFLLRA
jgi:hypothetical protein